MASDNTILVNCMKEKLLKTIDKNKLLFQWVKTGHISFNTYSQLLEYVNELNNKNNFPTNPWLSHNIYKIS